MGLIQKLKDIITGKQQEKQEQTENYASLLAVLVPKKTFTDETYKDERKLVDDACYADYFDSCAEDLERAIEKTYLASLNKVEGEYFDTGVSYTFFLDENKTTIKYTVQGVDRWKELITGDQWSSAIMTTLGIKAETIDLKKAGLLLGKMLETHLIEYREHSLPQFGVFYADEKSNAKSGIELLNEMDVKPTEVAEFWNVMYFCGHNYKKLESEILPKQ